LVKPARVTVVAVVLGPAVHVVPSIDVSTRYEVTTEPPFVDGTIHEMVRAESATVATTFCGADGVVDGVALTATDAAPSPAAFVATTRNE
jgi:hypothetical protein